MPDFATHHIFGDRMELPAAASEYPVFYRWGLQGPDLLFYRKVLTGAPYHKTGNRIHKEVPNKIFSSMIAHCKQCTGEAKRQSEAYMYGFAAHYLLDSTVHPYVFALQGKASQFYKTPAPLAVHGHIESDIDMDLYGYLYGSTVCNLQPERYYALNRKEKKTIGAIYTHLLYDVFQILISPEEIAASLTDMLAFEKMLYSGSHMVSAVADIADKLKGDKCGGYLSSHIKGRQPQWDSLNLNGEPWTDPWSGLEHHETVPELMENASEGFHSLVGILERNAAGAVIEIPVRLNFSGQEMP